MEPTSEQNDIINYDGSRVVIAKPGSGKTFTLAFIIKGILADCPSYRGVIAISFTNKASKELRNRCLGSGLGKRSSFFGTIDKFCIGEIILPYLPHIFGYPEQNVSIKSLRDEESLNLVPEDLANKIMAFSTDNRNDMPDKLLEIIQSCYNNGVIFLELVSSISLYVLQKCKASRSYLKARYSHIIIDEYQDTGSIQHEIFKILSGDGLIGFAVGDLEQSIFGFAGKNPKYLQSLASNESFRAFALNKNHRCHPSIVNYSLRLMSNNTQLLESDNKHVFYKRVEGDEAKCAEWITEKHTKIKEKYEIACNNNMAILVRGRATGQRIADSLTIPYKHFLDTELDTDSGLWSEVFRGVLQIIMAPNGNVVDFIEDYFVSFDREQRQLYELLNKLKSVTCNPENLIKHIDTFFLVSETIHPGASTEKSKRLLEEVLSSQELLMSYIPATPDQVQIMTLHKSKGLEFDAVFHMDLYDWILPGFEYIKNNNQEAWTQDINLHYVGITRAKKCCILLGGSQRHNYQGRILSAKESAFLSTNNLSNLRVNL